MKKNQVSYTANWIFGLVAGAIILMFILNIALSQKKTFEYKISKTISETIIYSINVALNSPNFFNDVSRMELFDLQTICYDDYLGIYLSNYENKINFILYSPLIGKGTKAFIWSLPYQLAYPITNFVYFLTPQNKIIIINSSNSFINTLCSNKDDYFHPNANVVCVGSSNVQDVVKDMLKNEILVSLTIVTSSEDSINWNDFSDLLKKTKYPIKKDYFSLIKIQNADDFPVKVTFSYWNLTDVAQKRFYVVSYPHLVGAIISGNPDLFFCVSRKAAMIASMIGKIIKSRTHTLENSTITGCRAYYLDLENTLSSIIENENAFNYLTDQNLAEEYLMDYNAIKNKEDILIQENCELLY